MNKETSRKNGWWWVQTKDAGIVPGYCFQGHFSDDDGVVRVLEPCNYQELQLLKVRYAELKDGTDALRKLFNFTRRNQDKEVERLRDLLKECYGCVRTLKARGVSECNGSNLNDLLTRINAAIGESEE